MESERLEHQVKTTNIKPAQIDGNDNNKRLHKHKASANVFMLWSTGEFQGHL
jgi:hypothetical protein